jgi:ParB-like chromosome segregation protein Spo0J
MKTISPAFDFQGVTLPLTALKPIRQVKPFDAAFGKYRTILASIREVGVIEPLIVYPEAGVADSYFVLDGHLRLKALQELKRTDALCLIARDNDVLTYNDKVNRLSVIQEHAMIRRAIEQGVTPEAIAKALAIDLPQVLGKVNLLDGIDAEAVNLLKDRPITAKALRLSRRVKPARQIEMAQLMVASDNYSNAYAQALLVGTPADQLVGKKPTRLTRGLSPEEVARLEKEMEHLETELRSHQDRFGENSLRLNAAQRYVKRLLENANVKRFLGQKYRELLEEFESLLALESI